MSNVRLTARASSDGVADSTCRTASLANADTVTRVASTPGRPAWMTTSAPPACSARIRPASVAGAMSPELTTMRSAAAAASDGSDVGELAEPQVAAAGGLGLDARCR